MTVRVAVLVRTALVTTDVAEMLTDALSRAGATASCTTTETGALDERADVAILVGGGVEFGPLTPTLSQFRTRPRVALWCLEPIPPPGLGPKTVRRGLQMAALDDRLSLPRAGIGGPLRRLLPARLRSQIARARSRLGRGGPSLTGDDHQSGLRRLDQVAFRRLRWVTENVAAGAIDEVMATNVSAVETLAERGVFARQIPVGYHPWMGHDEGRPRDLEVVFLGRPIGERVDRLRDAGRRLQERGVDLTVPDPVWASAERAALLNRTKVLLNLRNNTWHAELLRFVLGMACGAAVVSETPLPSTAPFIPGRHFHSATPEDLPELVTWLLTDEGERRRTTSAARDLITTSVTMDAVAKGLLDRFESRHHAP